MRLLDSINMTILFSLVTMKPVETTYNNEHKKQKK